MARSFLTAINLNKNELQNAAIQNLAGAPSSPVKGQLYFNTTDNTLYYCENSVGPIWTAAKSAPGATPASTVTTQAVGDAGTVGVSTNFAREDHKHGMPLFGTSTAVTAFGQGKADGASNNIARADHTHGTPTHINADHNSISLSALAAPSVDLSMNGFKITSLGPPTNGTDATNKTYVDNSVAGLAWKDSVRVLLNANLTASGNQTIDGVTTVTGDRVLLTFQTVPEANGIWVTAVGAWARATDADTMPELAGAAVFVEEGTTFRDTAWVCTNDRANIINVDAVTWVQFAGGGTVTAGAGMTQSGNTLNVIAANGSITVAANDLQVGYAGTGGANGSAVTAARSDHNHDATYVNVGGDTMTGALTMNTGAGNAITTPSGTIDAATFTAHGTGGGLVASSGGIVSLSGSGASLSVGGTFSSVSFTSLAEPVHLPNLAPSAATDATTKQYVDGLVTAKAGKFTAAVAAAVSTVINHALNTRDVIVNVYRVASPYDTIECDVERTDVNNVTVRFAVAPSAGEYRVVVAG